MEGEGAFLQFFRKLVEDPNIAGVALSKMKPRGIYTHFFVKDFGISESMSRTLDTTGDLFPLLTLAAQDQAGYCSYIGLGVRSFDEAEKSFRRGWNRRIQNDPFHYPPKSEELDLIVIAKFE